MFPDRAQQIFSPDISGDLSIGTKLLGPNIITASYAVQVLYTGLPEERKEAAAVLLHFSKGGDQQSTLVKSGVVSPLIQLVKRGSPSEQSIAVTILYNISTVTTKGRPVLAEGFMDALREADGVPPVVSLMVRAPPMLADKAIALLIRLAGLEETIKVETIKQAGGFHGLVRSLGEGSGVSRESALRAVMVISESKEGRDSLVLDGGVTHLVTALISSDTCHTERDLVMRILLNLSREPLDQEALCASQIIPPLVNKIKDADNILDAVQHGIVTVLAELARKYTHHEYLRQQGMIQILIKLLSEGQTATKEQAAKALNELASDAKSENQRMIRESRGIIALVKAKGTGSEAAQAYASSTLAKLAETSDSVTGGDTKIPPWSPRR